MAPKNGRFESGEEYTEYADLYDLFFGDVKEDVSFYLSECAAEKTIAELGVGTGRLAKKLVENGHKVFGIDANEQMLEHARSNLGCLVERVELIRADVRTMRLKQKFSTIIAPFGLVSFFLTDEDRLQAFRSIRIHLKPGGVWIYDDVPNWLSSESDGGKLEFRRIVNDPQTGLKLRLQYNTIDVENGAYTIQYHFIDWIHNNSIQRRKIIPVIYRNVPLERELELLRLAGFSDILLFGGFDHRPFSYDNIRDNQRLVVKCQID